MKKIILLLSLCASPFALLSMDQPKLNVVALYNLQSDFFDKETYNQILVENPCTSMPTLFHQTTNIEPDLNRAIQKNRLSQANPKPIFFATERNALFALNYLAKNPTLFSALILQNAQLDDYNYILNLHRNVPNIPIIFFNTQPNQRGNATAHFETKILYAKMKQRSETELKTYLIPAQKEHVLGINQWINNILIHEGLLEGTPICDTMKLVQPIVQIGIGMALKDIEKKEKIKIFGIGASVVIGVFSLILLLYKAGAAEKITCLFKH